MDSSLTVLIYPDTSINNIRVRLHAFPTSTTERNQAIVVDLPSSISWSDAGLTDYVAARLPLARIIELLNENAGLESMIHLETNDPIDDEKPITFWNASPLSVLRAILNELQNEAIEDGRSLAEVELA